MEQTIRRMTQQERVLAWLRSGRPITQWEAWRDLGITRLGARIWDLRRAGWRIERRMVAVTNRWGETCHVAQYYIPDLQQSLLPLGLTKRGAD